MIHWILQGNRIYPEVEAHREMMMEMEVEMEIPTKIWLLMETVTLINVRRKRRKRGMLAK